MGLDDDVLYAARSFDITRLRSILRHEAERLTACMACRPDFAESPEASAFHALMAEVDAKLLDAWNALPAQLDAGLEPLVAADVDEPCEMGAETATLFLDQMEESITRLRCEAEACCLAQTFEYAAVESRIIRFADETGLRIGL